jgi:hypothetical protein
LSKNILQRVAQMHLDRPRLLCWNHEKDWVRSIVLSQLYNWLTRTSGIIIPLQQASAIPDVITGLAHDTTSSEKLVKQIASDVAKKKGQTASAIAADLYPKLSDAKTKLDTLTVTNIYNANANGTKNANTWFEATALNDDTRGKIVDVR